MRRVRLNTIALDFGGARFEEGAVVDIDADTPAELVAVLEGRIAASTAEELREDGDVSPEFVLAAAEWSLSLDAAFHDLHAVLAAVEAGGSIERAAFVDLLRSRQERMAGPSDRIEAIMRTALEDAQAFSGGAQHQPEPGSVSTPDAASAGVEGAPAENPAPAVMQTVAAFAVAASDGAQNTPRSEGGSGGESGGETIPPPAPPAAVTDAPPPAASAGGGKADPKPPRLKAPPKPKAKPAAPQTT